MNFSNEVLQELTKIGTLLRVASGLGIETTVQQTMNHAISQLVLDHVKDFAEQVTIAGINGGIPAIGYAESVNFFYPHSTTHLKFQLALLTSNPDAANYISSTTQQSLLNTAKSNPALAAKISQNNGLLYRNIPTVPGARLPNGRMGNVLPQVNLTETFRQMKSGNPIQLSSVDQCRDIRQINRAIFKQSIKDGCKQAFLIGGIFSTVIHAKDLINGETTKFIINVSSDIGKSIANSTLCSIFDYVKIPGRTFGTGAVAANILICGTFDVKELINNGDWQKMGRNTGINTAGALGSWGAGTLLTYGITAAGISVSSWVAVPATLVVACGSGFGIRYIADKFLPWRVTNLELIKQYKRNANLCGIDVSDKTDQMILKEIRNNTTVGNKLLPLENIQITGEIISALYGTTLEDTTGLTQIIRLANILGKDNTLEGLKEITNLLTELVNPISATIQA